MMPYWDTQKLVDSCAQLQRCYRFLESTICYRLILGGTRHFGYYVHGARWPFPLNRALRAMEENLGQALDLKPGSYVLDAGCGVSHVGVYLATNFGFKIHGIDIVDEYLELSRRNIKSAGLSENQVFAQEMDMSNLDALDPATFDGVFTMESLSQISDPQRAMHEFNRILRPGGKIALFEFDHVICKDPDSPISCNGKCVEVVKTLAQPGVLPLMLCEAGFTDVKVRDYSVNILPMMVLFYQLAFGFFLVVNWLGLERFFASFVAGFRAWCDRECWRYVCVTASKPARSSPPVESD